MTTATRTETTARLVRALTTLADGEERLQATFGGFAARMGRLQQDLLDMDRRLSSLAGYLGAVRVGLGERQTFLRKCRDLMEVDDVETLAEAYGRLLEERKARSSARIHLFAP